MDRLQLEGYTHDKSLTLKQFLYNFLTKENVQRNTLTMNGSLHTRKNKERSLGDITDICRNYYNTNLGEVKATLLSFGKKLVGHYCPTINKRVYNHSDLNTKSKDVQWNKGVLDEYGVPITYNG